MRLLLIITLLIAAGLAACGPDPTPTPTPSPTPTPPFGLPPLTLPADEAPHDVQTEWWYFNAHLRDAEGGRYALHDVVFQVQQLASDRTMYVRQIGLADARSGEHASSERIRVEEQPLGGADGFTIRIGDSEMSGEGGETYRLKASAGGWSYDLALESAAGPLLHDGDGLVDFAEAGVTYYYSRPRLEIAGTLTTPDGRAREITGLAWLDKQWGNFQPVVVFWDWASIQLDDGTDIMVTNLRNAEQEPIDRYVTLRYPGEDEVRIGDEGFSFEPTEGTWTSGATDTAYPTHWRLRAPGEGIDLMLDPMVVESEFASSLLGVAYWEAGVDVLDAEGERVGQGFVELNWARTFGGG